MTEKNEAPATVGAGARGEESLESQHVNASGPETQARAGGGRLAIRCIADIAREELKWLWHNRIPLGKVSMLLGDPGLGKSLITLAITSTVSRGAGWPIPGEGRAPHGDTILISAEDDPADTIRPRLEAAGADLMRCHFLDGVGSKATDDAAPILRPWRLRDVGLLNKALEETPNCRLVVIDPISAYLAGTDTHKNADVREVLAPLSTLAAKYGVAVIVVSHLNKAQGGPAIYRATGSLAFTAAARAVYVVTKDRNDAARRLVIPLKANLAPDVTGLAYKIDTTNDGTPRIKWEPQTINVDADQALAEAPDFEARSQTDEAVEWLRGALADGPQPAGDLKRAANEDGIGKKPLRKARERLRIKPRKDGFSGSWIWELPKMPSEDAPDA